MTKLLHKKDKIVLEKIQYIYYSLYICKDQKNIYRLCLTLTKKLIL